MEIINGYVDHIIFQNSDNGYTVFALIPEGEGEPYTCVGMCKGLALGESIQAQGEWTTHGVYGEQFKISSYRPVTPKDELGMLRYLGSGAIRGVGEALARRIVSHFGQDSLRVLEEEPELLSQVKGISVKKAMEIAAQLEEKRDLRQALVYLQSHGISQAQGIKIFEKYGAALYEKIRQNPYCLAEDIEGMGFRLADRLAASLGISADAPCRIQSGLLYTLQQALAEGHMYLPPEQLLERAEQILSAGRDALEDALELLVWERKLRRQQEGYFLAAYAQMELSCAHRLRALDLTLPSAGEGEEYWRELALSMGIEANAQQMEAAALSASRGVFLLSGGPGTGKTTTINLMLAHFDRQGKETLLAAPTGRAAKRMQEATGREAKTLHRLLELGGDVEGGRARFARDQEHPLEADVVIVDEMSMVDMPLFSALLKALLPGTRLVLVGDVDQLPSVGPGQVLRDLIESGVFACVVLEKIFRQSAQSHIIVNAHRVNKGQEPVMDNKSRDFFVLERENIQVIYKHMVELVRDKLPSYVEARALDIQVLTPSRKGPLGAVELNRVLQSQLNPPSPAKQEYLHGDTLFREGDKVMQIKNNYQAEWEIIGKYNIVLESGQGVFNGDMGYVVEIRPALGQLCVEFEEGKRILYTTAMLEELELAYAITIHKSQGSEYPAVVMPLLGGNPLLYNRNLLYTGLTRAKRCITILGSKAAIRAMVENKRQRQRYSALARRLIEAGEGE